MIADERYLTVDEVAKLLRLGVATVYRRVADGSIPAFKLGPEPQAPIRIDRRELERAFSRPGAHTHFEEIQ